MGFGRDIAKMLALNGAGFYVFCRWLRQTPLNGNILKVPRFFVRISNVLIKVQRSNRKAVK